MPGKVGVKIKAGRNLPVMDRGSDTTDAYVEIKLGNVTHKTDVCRKSLNPQWNTDWFRFEIDDAELQDEPLQIRLMDYDTYSANDAIGKVNISLNPLCLETSGQATQGKGTVLSGWIPVFDTMHGIRGEVNVIVKVDLFSDLNKFRQSSCGIQFFHSQCIPYGYRAQVIHGFVEELVVNDDPEYQWIDKIRTPRASNEARQVVFLKLSGQVQRKMGLKAINLGANAVIGYTQCFDLEGDVGVVARGIGTAVTLIKDTNVQPTTADNALIEERTLKYLEFLTCSASCTPSWPEYKLHIRKSHSSTLFELQRATDQQQQLPSDEEEGDVMLELIRQEDARGEQPVKKLKHHMRRWTHSSRNLVNEKYAAFMRKISDSGESEKSTAALTKSMSNLFISSFFIKEEVGASSTAVSSTNTAHNLLHAVRKPSLKAKHHQQQPLLRASLKKGAHPIVRSVSDDSAMRQPLVTQTTLLTANVDDDFQDNTRSSPNITRGELKGHDDGSLFGTFSSHAPHLKNEPKLIQKVSSSNASSCSEQSDSSSTAEDDSATVSVLQTLNNTCDALERRKLENLLKTCNKADAAAELQAQQWLQPGCGGESDDEEHNSAPRRRPSLLHELKTFSQHMQHLMHIGRKPMIAEISSTSARAPPQTLALLPALQLERARKPFYASQPDIFEPTFVAADVESAAVVLQRSHSLINLQSLPSSLANRTTFPLLQICPSTPTPSESDNSPRSPISPVRVPFVVAPLSKTSNLLNPSAPFVHYLNINYTNTSQSSLLATSSLSSAACAPSRVTHSHNRSLHELSNSNSNSGSVNESPSMKRFTTPASAAVVAAASGPALGSRSKLSPSPSKMQTSTAAATTLANTSATLSENSTSSTASTMIPKEVGEICRRSSDSDLSITPKGNSFCVASERLVAATALMRLNQPAVGVGKAASATDSALDMLEYPFLTMTKYPSGFIMHLGATVAARSVKLLERVPNPDEPEVRDSWWTELRMEIRSHARALGCNVVLGYSESTTISDDVCVLSATGTAAVINMAYNRSVSQTDIFTKPTTIVSAGVMSVSLEDRDALKELRNGIGGDSVSAAGVKDISGSLSGSTGQKKTTLPPPPISIVKNSCTMCHIPYNLSSVPFNVKMKRCAICRKGRVPDVLLATLEVPEYMQVTGRGCFMQAQVVRAKKDLRSELNAKEISDGLPFLEYELHRVLINKLKAKGMNAIFGLKAQVAIGERMIALIATGTALFLTALPVPQVPKIVAGNSWTDKQKLNELQKKLQETFERNQEIYQLKCIDPDLMSSSGVAQTDKQSDTDESDEEVIEIDLNCGNKDTCVLEVDDIEDLEIISLLMEPYPPEGFHVVNTQMVPGMMDMEAVKNLQMFTQVWRAKLDVGQNINGFPKHFQRLLQTIYFKLRTMIPCAICDLRFRLDLPESDQIQLLVTGMALGLGDATNKIKYRRKTVNNGSAPPTANDSANSVNAAADMNGSAQHGHKRPLQEEDYIFPLDEDQMVETPTPTTNLPAYGMHSLKLRKTSPSRGTMTTTTLASKTSNGSFRNRYFPLRDRSGVDITPLSFIPGGKIEKYLGNLNFFFIRESTSIRENGGISGFVHGFITELLAVVRAHIAAVGGNAMVSFYMTELILFDNQHKNQGQCLISIGGDAVNVSYYADD